MRTIKILGFVQIGMLVFLFGTIVQLKDREIDATPAPRNTPATDSSGSSTTGRTVTTANSVDEDQLRRIIREELGALHQGLPGSIQLANTNTTSGRSYDPQAAYRREQVLQRLDYFSSVGSISEPDMQQLQSEIAQLDTASRKEALSRLVQALNSERLDGRL